MVTPQKSLSRISANSGLTVTSNSGQPDVTVTLHNLNFVPSDVSSRNSSVGIELSYGLDDQGSRVRSQAGAGNFSLNHRVQNGSGAHPASYAMGTRGSFLGGKAAGA
jgi:hypothetical protein